MPRPPLGPETTARRAPPAQTPHYSPPPMSGRGFPRGFLRVSAAPLRVLGYSSWSQRSSFQVDDLATLTDFEVNGTLAELLPDFHEQRPCLAHLLTRHHDLKPA